MIRIPNSLDPDQVPYFVGPDLVKNVCKAVDIMTRVSINAINFYLRRGSEPDCLIL